MNFLDRIIELPKISIRQLEQRARGSHPNISPNFSLNKENNSHSQAIIVASPFYPKVNHPLKCECRFHRLKKTHKVDMKKFQPKQKSTEVTILKDKYLDKSEPKVNQSTLRPYIINARKMSPQLQKGLVYQKADSHSLLKLEKQKFQTKRSNSQSNQPQQQSNKFLNMKFSFEDLNWKKLKKIDTNNAQFINLISKRLENEKYKSSYLKTLFSFIKMKTNIDKFYMWNSKAYLSNSLNILLNHFSMAQLMNIQELDEGDIEKIAFYMGCQNKQVKPILGELNNLVSEMQVFLAQLKRNQENNRLKSLQNEQKSLQNVEKIQLSDSYAKDVKVDSYKAIISCEKYIEPLPIQDEKQTQKRNIYTKKSSKIDLVIEQNDSQQKRSSTKGSMLNLRKSVLRSTLQFPSSAVKSIGSNLQNQEKTQKEVNQSQNHARKSQVFSNLTSKSRSNRSTVFATINECKEESRQSALKKDKKAKTRKIKILKLPKQNSFQQKYSDIKFQKFCSKNQFTHLIDQIQRLDQNDQERAQKMFNLLNIEQFIDNAEKIDQMMDTFTPLFNDRWKDKLLKRIILVKDRKCIEKLSLQLDFLLSQVKRTDPRQYDNEDLCPYKQDPILKNTCNQRIIRCRYSKQEYGKIIKRLKTTYNQPQQKIQSNPNNRFTEDEKNLLLQQTDLNDIQPQALSPMLSQSIYCKNKNIKKDIVYIRPEEYTSEEQKKILQYMHQKHHNTFDYLSNQISTLCSKLTQDQSTL